jgi:predicted Zn-dependent protease with MMP-like domain
VQPVSPDEFEGYVADALDDLPPELAAQFSNVVVVVEDENEDEPDLLGLYEGVALTERGDHYSGVLPDRISLYRIPLCLLAEDTDHLVEEIQVTVVHEFAHHVGIDDDRLHALGWA